MLLRLIECYDYLLVITFILYAILSTNMKLYIKSLGFILLVDIIYTTLTYVFSFNLMSVILFNIFIVICVLSKYKNNIQGQELDKTKINIIFYKPKKLKQFLISIFGINVSSSGLVIFNNGWYIYQFRRNKKTLQKIEPKENTEEYIKEKYIIINTDINNSEYIYKEEKARQLGTLFLRFNCLRVFKNTLNKSKLFKYQGEIFPSIYLLKLKLRGIVK